jgi:hypothetical protein
MDEMSAAEQLYLNLHKERSTRCLLCCFFFGKVRMHGWQQRERTWVLVCVNVSTSQSTGAPACTPARTPQLLTPQQLARVAVTSYPWFPDPLSVCRMLAPGGAHTTHSEGKGHPSAAP